MAVLNRFYCTIFDNFIRESTGSVGMVNVLKFQTLFLFLFSNKMLVIRAGTKCLSEKQTQKTLIRLLLGLPCLSRLLQQTTARNFTKFTVVLFNTSLIPGQDMIFSALLYLSPNIYDYQVK